MWNANLMPINHQKLLVFVWILHLINIITEIHMLTDCYLKFVYLRCVFFFSNVCTWKHWHLFIWIAHSFLFIHWFELCEMIINNDNSKNNFLIIFLAMDKQFSQHISLHIHIFRIFLLFCCCLFSCSSFANTYLCFCFVNMNLTWSVDNDYIHTFFLSLAGYTEAILLEIVFLYQLSYLYLSYVWNEWFRI